MKHDGVWAVVGLVVIVVGLFGVMAISGSDEPWEPPPQQARDADSMMIYLMSAYSDTSWIIYIPMKGIPPLDTLGVVWWTGGIQQSILYTGWTDVNRTISGTE